jgi:hypothetical protein
MIRIRYDADDVWIRYGQGTEVHLSGYECNSAVAVIVDNVLRI